MKKNEYLWINELLTSFEKNNRLFVQKIKEIF